MAFFIPNKGGLPPTQLIGEAAIKQPQAKLIAAFVPRSYTLIEDLTAGGGYTPAGTGRGLSNTEFGDAFYQTDPQVAVTGWPVVAESTSGTHTIQIVGVWPAARTSSAPYYLDSQTGRLVFGHNNTDSIAFYDGTWRTFSYNPFGNGEQNIILELDGAASEGRLYVNGGLIDTVAYSAVNISGTTRVFSRYVADAAAHNPINLELTMFNIWDGLLSDPTARSEKRNAFEILKPRRKFWIMPVAAAGSHDLFAVSEESLSQVSSPVLGQAHALTATSVESASEVTAPALTQAHALAVVSVESATEVSSPALAQVHTFAAVSVESTTELTAPVIGQAHALSPNSVESATEVTAPVLTENAAGVHNLTATSVESATEVTAPVLGQVHALAPSGVESATELSAPTLAQVHVLFPNSVESVSEVSAPTLTTGFALTPVSVESATEVTAPTLAQVHVLYPASVESASEVSAPAIGQAHALAAVSVESATELSSPVLAIAGAASLTKFSFTAVLPETIITTALPRTVIISAIPSTILSVAV